MIIIDEYGNKKPIRKRVAIINGKYLIIKNTYDDVWHGYYCKVDELKTDELKALQKAGIVDKKGKILNNVKNQSRSFSFVTRTTH